jgi:hypothetical protein
MDKKKPDKPTEASPEAKAKRQAMLKAKQAAALPSPSDSAKIGNNPHGLDLSPVKRTSPYETIHPGRSPERIDSHGTKASQC